MNQEEISFKGRLNCEEALAMKNLHSKIVIGIPVRILLVSISLIFITLIYTASSGKSWKIDTIALLLLFIYFPFGHYIVNRLSVIYQYKKKPELIPETTVTIDKNKIFSSSNEVELKVPWSQLESVAVGKKGVLFVLKPSAAWFFLPSRLFIQNTKKEQILQFANLNNVKVR